MLIPCIVFGIIGVVIGGGSALSMHYRDRIGAKPNAEFLERLFSLISKLGIAGMILFMALFMAKIKETRLGWLAVGLAVLAPMLGIILTAYAVRSRRAAAAQAEKNDPKPE